MLQTGLEERVSERTATVGVLGLGYVGLPLSLAFADTGFDVVGFDIDTERVDRLQSGHSYVDDVGNHELSEALSSRFSPTSDSVELADVDVAILAVPTDVRDGVPDLSAVRAATESVAAARADADETLLVVGSTVPPGTVETVVDPVLEANGLTPGEDILRAVVPERLNPGGDHDVSEIPLVVGADSDIERAAATELFGSIAETYPVSTTDVAAAAKVLENTYRLVNISLVNDFASFAEDAGIDLWETIDAASTKPFGFQAFYPGAGAGGHCIPVDPQLLTWAADRLDSSLPTIETAHEINSRMPETVADRIVDALHARGVDPTSATVAALGVTYKPDVGDVRHSPALAVVDELVGRGITVRTVDPHAPEVDLPTGASRVETVEEALDGVDCTVLLVPHEVFDIRAIAEAASLVYDVTNSVPEDVETPVVTFAAPE